MWGSTRTVHWACTWYLASVSQQQPNRLHVALSQSPMLNNRKELSPSREINTKKPGLRREKYYCFTHFRSGTPACCHVTLLEDCVWHKIMWSKICEKNKIKIPDAASVFSLLGILHSRAHLAIIQDLLCFPTPVVFRLRGITSCKRLGRCRFSSGRTPRACPVACAGATSYP